MKVLYVCSGVRNNGKPGAVVQNQINSVLNEEGLLIDIFTINKPGLIGYVNAFIPLLKRIKKTKPTIIHSHYSLSAFLTTFVLLLSIYNNCKHIVSLMGSDVQAKGWKRQFIQLFSNKKWNKTIVKSEVMARKIKLKKYTVLPNGVDLELVKPSKFNKDLNSPLVILFAANPNRPEKNISLAKESLKNIPEADLKIVFNLPHVDVIKEINNCDIVLLTSKWEGSPNIIKEAMACNKCIVSTDVGDVKELFGELEGCFLSEQNAHSVENSIRDAIDFVINNHITKGRSRIIELGLSASSIKDKLLKIYLN